MVLAFIFALGVVVCVVLIYAQFHFNRMGEPQVQSAVEQAEHLVEKGKLYRAEKALYETLRLNGWDYRSYLEGKKTNKAINIEQVVPRIVLIARTLNIVPVRNFAWMPQAFYLLGKIYLSQGKSKKALRLFEDTINLVDGYGEDIPYAIRCRYMSDIHRELSLLEYNSKNFLASLKLQTASYLEQLAALKGAGDEEAFSRQFPYKGDELLEKNLEGLGYSKDLSHIVDIVNKTVRNSPGRINTQILNRDLDRFFSDAGKIENADFAAAKDIITVALSRTSPGVEPEQAEKKKRSGKDPIILE